jgi:arylesterase / paraoxonase
MKKIVGIIILFMIFVLFLGGEFYSINEGNRAIQCTQINNLPGAEDMIADHHNKLIYVSIDDRRALLNGEKKRGEIHVISTHSSKHKPRSLPLVDHNLRPIKHRFHPHGIDLIEVDGEVWLWVVNHHFGLLSTQKPSADYPYSHSIDIFKVDHPQNPKHLILQQQLLSPLLTSPNDLVVLSPTEAYITNDHASRGPVGKMFETLTKRSWSGVVHYHQEQWKIAYQGIAFANGIEISKDHQNILVASANGDGLYNFHKMKTGHLRLDQHIAMKNSLDNLSWNQSHDQVWITSHPRTLRFLLHALDGTIASPTISFSTHFNIKTHMLATPQLELGKGLPISGGSITIEADHHLWVGSVFESFILRCK